MNDFIDEYNKFTFRKLIGYLLISIGWIILWFLITNAFFIFIIRRKWNYLSSDYIIVYIIVAIIVLTLKYGKADDKGMRF
jgi:hypothetical protein